MRRLGPVALCLIVACAAPAIDPGRLVVTGPGGAVSLVDPDGGDVQVLVAESDVSHPVQPTSSPDGSVVVWSAMADRGPQIAVWEDGTVRALESPTLPFFYAFSPDGTHLAALGNAPAGAGVALVMVDLEGAVVELVESGQPYYLDWHPDGDRLAVHRGPGELGILDLDGERRRLDMELGRFQAPAWTPDGRLVVPLRSGRVTAALGPIAQADLDELAVVDESGDAAPLVEVQGMVMFDVGDGRVAYVEGEGIGPLSVVGLDGDGHHVVDDGEVVALEWSPDGTLLLYHTVDPDEGLTPHVWDGTRSVSYPPYLPTAVALTQYLPFWSQYTRTITHWAPDGSAFVYAAADDAASGIWIQPLEGERRHLGAGDMVTWTTRSR